MKVVKYSRRLGSTIGFAGLLIAQASVVRAAEPATGGTLELEEIVVTATKRPEKLQEVPISVEVVSQGALQSQNLADTSDLKRLVPGLEFRHAGTPGNNAFNIRGVETLATSYGLEQSGGVAFDGVPLARPVGAVADLVDIQQVEVLKGPQGMLFGKNASAGLVNIKSASPELGKTEEMFRVSWGTLNNQQYSGTANLAVTDDSAVRVSAWKFQHDGTIHEVNTGQDMNDKNSGGARFKYRWKANDNLDLNFTGEWTSHDENGTGYSIRSFPSQFGTTNSGAAVEAYELGQGTVPSETNRTARGLNVPYYDKGHTNAYTGQADYAIGEGTLTAIVSYRDIKNDASFDPYPSDNPYTTQFKNTDKVAYDQTSEEIRYASPAEDRLHYVVGLFNFRLNLQENQGFGLTGMIPSGPSPTAPLVNAVLVDADFAETLHNDSYAAFGEATFDITKDLHFIAGLRESKDKLNVSMNRTGAVLTSLGGPFADSNKDSYSDLSWRTGLQFQFTPDAMVYATASRGYKGPGIGYSLSTTSATLAATNNGIIKPEIVHAYEVGLKSQWFDHRVTTNVAIYDEFFSNFQTSAPLATGAGVDFINAKEMVTKGVDVSVNWLVTQALSLSASYNYTDAKYTDYKNAGCYNGQTAGDGCTTVLLNPALPAAAPGNSVSTQDLSGHSVANTPKNAASLTARYEQPVSSTLTGFVQANGNYRSAVNFSSLGDPLNIQGGYTLVNLSVGVNATDGSWGVSVYGNNVLDKHYVDMFLANGSGNSVFFNDIGYQDLRTFGVAVNARF